MKERSKASAERASTNVFISQLTSHGSEDRAECPENQPRLYISGLEGNCELEAQACPLLPYCVPHISPSFGWILVGCSKTLLQFDPMESVQFAMHTGASPGQCDSQELVILVG